jgi:ABC-type transport system involved in cytochrome c biogenesis permease subunit
MKNKLLIILVPIFWIIGTFLSLTQLYVAPDEKVHLFEGSLFYFVASVLIFSILILVKNESKYLKWLSITSIILFTLFGTVFSLICLYSSPMPNEEIDPLASAIFFLSAVIASSGTNFFIKNSKV